MNMRLKTLLAIIGLSLPLAAAADFTHLNVDHRELVHLRSGNIADSIACTSVAQGNRPLKEVRPTGQLSNEEYSVPAGKELIITDATYFIGLDTGDWSGLVIQPLLSVKLVDDTGGFLTPSRTLVTLPGIETPTNGNRVLFDNVNFTAGVRVASRRSICTSVRIVFGASLLASQANIKIGRLTIKGYLVDKAQ